MATTTASEAARLTDAFRAAEARRAAIVAAAVALYFRQRVDVRSPRDVERWLAALVPVILREHAASAARAALFGNTIRTLELGRVADPFRFEPVTVDDLEARVRTSLVVTGSNALESRLEKISGLEISPAEERALIAEVREISAAAAGGAAARHVQNGGRETLRDGIARDAVALGWVRVTKPNACYFCAMLASRGEVYSKDSFVDMRVHDSCGCSLKPVYREDDELVARSRTLSDQWADVQSRRPAGVSMISWWRSQYAAA